MVTLDSALANMGRQAQRRLILKIDAEGFEPNVIVGASGVLAAGRVALIVWERGQAFSEGLGRDGDDADGGAALECGFRHFLPRDRPARHPPAAFDRESGYLGNISVGPQLLERSVFHSAAA